MAQKELVFLFLSRPCCHISWQLYSPQQPQDNILSRPQIFHDPHFQCQNWHYASVWGSVSICQRCPSCKQFGICPIPTPLLLNKTRNLHYKATSVFRALAKVSTTVSVTQDNVNALFLTMQILSLQFYVVFSKGFWIKKKKEGHDVFIGYPSEVIVNVTKRKFHYWARKQLHEKTNLVNPF